tara:strand:+ start:954 stop:1424 length:471 start_codon:yes stop_codon:yes gene_type:complete
MIYKIGDIETEFENFVTPTQELFESWKEEFLKLPSINNYNVWLCGGFINDWDTFDIDIILTNKPNYLELRELLIQGFKIGIKNNILVDIAHCDVEPTHFFKGEVNRIVYGKEIIKGNEVLDSLSDCVYEDLYKYKRLYPTKKQIERDYKVKPIRIN